MKISVERSFEHESDLTQIESDSTQIESDSTQIESDSTQSESDSTQSESDSTQIDCQNSSNYIYTERLLARHVTFIVMYFHCYVLKL